MKTIMVMFDSLRKDYLEPYGNTEMITPNFDRLAKNSVVYDNCYMGSMPCMPARRELHTGRYNFLHRIWGSLEPFDDSMPEILKKNGIYPHLITDHAHYFEDGGASYHTRYKSWEFIRGQQGDPWKAVVEGVEIPEHISRRDGMPLFTQDWVNREYVKTQEDYPIHKVFESACEFLDTNAHSDNWFLQVENFSPHEPFHAPQKYIDMYQKKQYTGRHFNWPDYATVKETDEEIENCLVHYKALVTMCDDYLGKILDKMDEYNMWEDTMLIVNVDHGFLLTEHGRWGKRVCANYNEIANIPFFVYNPITKKQGERSDKLVQTIDIAPTILDFFSLDIPKDMQGIPLDSDRCREGALFGLFNAQVNCTDGRYVYMRGATEDSEPANNYTLMPTHMHARFSPAELETATLEPPFKFTKNCPVLKTKPQKLMQKGFIEYDTDETLLFDLKADPKQLHPIENEDIKECMSRLMVKLMKQNDSPVEQYKRLGLVDYI